MLNKKTSISFSLVGLPNVGKSTLFNILTRSIAAQAENFPFCTIEPNIGFSEVIDKRVDRLASISKSEKIIYSQVKVVDVAGLVMGASEGAGLGNQFLATVRQTDAIVHVIRLFDDDNVTHVAGKVDPLDDKETIETELMIADMKMCEDICIRLEKKSRTDQAAKKKVVVLQKAIKNLSDSIFLKNVSWSDEEMNIISEYCFLTSKPIIYVLNIADHQLLNRDYVNNIVKRIEGKSIIFCGSLENICYDLEKEQKQDLLDEYGYDDSCGSSEIVKEVFSSLGLISFFTAGEKESRSWAIVNGTLAPEAGGKIHNDIEKGFIRAEVISYDDYILCNGRQAAKDKGIARLAGKEYIVKDGDVILFLHKI